MKLNSRFLRKDPITFRQWGEPNSYHAWRCEVDEESSLGFGYIDGFGSTKEEAKFRAFLEMKRKLYEEADASFERWKKEMEKFLEENEE